jgi:hypothetical protein
MIMDLADFRYIPDAYGGGTVLVPFSFWRGEWDINSPPQSLNVYDRDGRDVIFEGGGGTYSCDSAAGTQEFVGWSFWESDDTEDPEAPCVQLFILHPDYPESSFEQFQSRNFV